MIVNKRVVLSAEETLDALRHQLLPLPEGASVVSREGQLIITWTVEETYPWGVPGKPDV